MLGLSIDEFRSGTGMSEAAQSSYPQGAQDTQERHARFVAENLRRIFLQIYRIVGNVEDAQDLTQEAFIKALQREDQLKDTEKAAHWLSRIASNTAIDFLRRHGRVSFTELEELPTRASACPSESPEQRVLRVGGQALGVDIADDHADGGGPRHLV